jgi:XTP/dITP diphosphohydrolase
MNYKLLLATSNQAKVREYESLLDRLQFRLVTPAELGITTVVDEVGESLEENARLKATVLAAESQLVALADDSGLELCWRRCFR